MKYEDAEGTLVVIGKVYVLNFSGRRSLAVTAAMSAHAAVRKRRLAISFCVYTQHRTVSQL